MGKGKVDVAVKALVLGEEDTLREEVFCHGISIRLFRHNSEGGRANVGVVVEGLSGYLLLEVGGKKPLIFVFQPDGPGWTRLYESYQKLGGDLGPSERKKITAAIEKRFFQVVSAVWPPLELEL